VSYRYWQNKFGLDHNAELGVCNVIVGGAVTSTNSCTESSYQAGITVKF
jgi:putative N-acetylmannosamine-6-phosphate epimerase